MTKAPYRLGEEIGRGALGRVVRVHDDSTGSCYAGKILHASHQGDGKARERFASEAAILAEVQDENVVRVYGIEEIEGETVMRMELVEGPSLAKLIALEAPFTSERIIAISSKLVSGLRAAHLAGLVHRDLKPLNVLLTVDETPKIADFGMARAASFAGIEESAFAVAGTPDYMAPECVDPLAVDARSDLYSLGCILYEMAVGVPPFQAATSFAMLEAHRNAAVPEIQTDLPPALTEIIYALLAKSPADRIQSAAAIGRRLDDISNNSSTALSVAAGKGLSVGGQCASCGHPLLAAVAVCFECGATRLSLDAGGYSLFVIGPGSVGDKLDAQLRQKLLKWIEASPSLGLDASPLAKKVPRLPFVVVSKISESSALALARAMRGLGIECNVHRGGAFRLPAVRKKAWLLSGRLLAIGAGTSAWFYSSSVGTVLLPLVGVGLLAGVASGWVMAGKGITKKSLPESDALPQPVLDSLAGVSVVVENMSLRRHRESLRGIVERVLALCVSLPPETLSSCELDLASLIDRALIACARMDEIEVSLVEEDMRNPSPSTLTKMRERDRWAGRLLEVTAFLDSLRARTAALQKVGSRSSDAGDRLEELRAHIAALEEVQEL